MKEECRNIFRKAKSEKEKHVCYLISLWQKKKLNNENSRTLIHVGGPTTRLDSQSEEIYQKKLDIERTRLNEWLM